jgi:hypothetical protein
LMNIQKFFSVILKNKKKVQAKVIKEISTV